MQNGVELQPADEQSLDVLLPRGRDRTRAEAIHRVQIGLAGLGAVVLMIALASMIMERAQLTEAVSAPDASATDAPAASGASNDPLAEAGVVPDMPAQNEPAPLQQEQAIVPEQGDSPRSQ